MDEARLRSYLKERFGKYRDDLHADDDLRDIVDSLGLFELASFVEREFEISIPTAEFAPSRFSSISNIVGLIEDLRNDRRVYR
jgi:acyl carrier protein